MARFFRHGELPLVLLALLAQRPMHGYELMSSCRAFSARRTSAVPGTVYPAVDALAMEGLLIGQAREGRTVYRASAEGEQALISRADVLATVELRTGARFGRGDSLEDTGPIHRSSHAVCGSGGTRSGRSNPRSGRRPDRGSCPDSRP